MPTRLANIGYMGMKKEATKGTAVTPNVFVPLYDETVTTDIQLDSDSPIIGNKAARLQSIQGMRSHGGDVSILAEPNTLGYVADALLNKSSTSGSDPYTHNFILSNTVDPNSYTVDLLKGQIVHRYIGAEFSELGVSFDKNKMMFKAKMSALKAFTVREISGVASAVVTLKTNYDPVPTDGLVVSDLVRIEDVSAGTYQDFTISSLTNTTVTLSGSPSGIVSGDLFFLRGATPSFSLLTPFMWSKTQFCFGVDASTALSATQTRVEQGSKWTLFHRFAEDKGSERSGAFDPATLDRTLGDVEIDIKQFFDSAQDANRFLTVTKRALVVRSYAGASNQHECRLTINNFKFKEQPNPMKSGEIIYMDSKLVPEYDTTDAQIFDLKVINGVASI